MDAATHRAAARAAQAMTPGQHAEAVRSAAAALNQAILDAALAGVGVTIEHRLSEFVGGIVPNQVRVTPWRAL